MKSDDTVISQKHAVVFEQIDIMARLHRLEDRSRYNTCFALANMLFTSAVCLWFYFLR